MKLIFSHGRESGPWGFKIKRLSEIAKKRACSVESIDYRDCMDPDLRVERLLQSLSAQTVQEIILVGSSMGGYVSLVASTDQPVAGLFLMAPALYMPGAKHQHYSSEAAHVEIVHGWSDDVIPPQHSIDFAGQAGCDLHLLRGDHALNTSIEAVEAIFDSFLDRVLNTRPA